MIQSLKRRVVFQLSFFRGYVKLWEGKPFRPFRPFGKGNTSPNKGLTTMDHEAFNKNPSLGFSYLAPENDGIGRRSLLSILILVTFPGRADKLQVGIIPKGPSLSASEWCVCL